MRQLFLNVWWSVAPSTEIRVFYRVSALASSLPGPLRARMVFVKTPYERCSPSEQAFLDWKFGLKIGAELRLLYSEKTLSAFG